MNVLHVGIFQDHCLGGDIVFKAGLIDNGVRHLEFDYRTLAAQIGIDRMNHELVRQAEGQDLVFIGKGELLYPSTLAEVRRRGSLVALWYGDLRPQPEPWLMENLKHCDAFFMSSAGDTLRWYFEQGGPGKAAFYINPSCPALVEQFSGIPRSVDPPLFTGTTHSSYGDERRAVYEYLCRRGDIQIIGSPRRVIKNRLLRRLYLKLRPVRYLRDRPYIESIVRSRFGIGVSAFQNVKYYTSDRLTHYLSFGKLYLAYRFPGCEDLFEGGKHLVYYGSVAELEEQIEFFLKDRDSAEEIGRRGQEKMLREYNAGNVVGMMLDIIDAGRSTRFPWVEVYP